MNKIDISKYGKQIPKDGIFVAEEQLNVDENAYEPVWYENKIKHSKISCGSVLGANYYKNPQTWLY